MYSPVLMPLRETLAFPAELVGPFDFAGGFDDRSDRPHPLHELMTLGYEDAFRQFVEPVVAPSGDRVGMHR